MELGVDGPVQEKSLIAIENFYFEVLFFMHFINTKKGGAKVDEMINLFSNFLFPIALIIAALYFFKKEK